jgi:hypothetical protein
MGLEGARALGYPSRYSRLSQTFYAIWLQLVSGFGVGDEGSPGSISPKICGALTVRFGSLADLNWCAPVGPLYPR